MMDFVEDSRRQGVCDVSQPEQARVSAGPPEGFAVIQVTMQPESIAERDRFAAAWRSNDLHLQ